MSRVEKQVASFVLIASLGIGAWMYGETNRVETRLCGDGPPCKTGIAYINNEPCWYGEGEIGGNGSPRPSDMEDCPGQ